MPVPSSTSVQEQFPCYTEFFVCFSNSFLCCRKCVMHFKFCKKQMARGIKSEARFGNKISPWQQLNINVFSINLFFER